MLSIKHKHTGHDRPEGNSPVFSWVDIGTICFTLLRTKNNPNKDGLAELDPFCWARSCFATLIKLVKWCGRIFKLILGEVKWEKRRNKTPRPYHVAKKLKWWFRILEVFCWDISKEFSREFEFLLLKGRTSNSDKSIALYFMGCLKMVGDLITQAFPKAA